MVIERTYLNIIKTMYGKPIASHTSLYSMMKTESISSKFRNKTRVPTLTLLFNIVLEVLFMAIREQKEIKEIQIENEEVKLFTICR